MSGMLPGVELARRRRTCHRTYEEATCHRHGSVSGGSWVRPLVGTAADASNMDESALRARRRLEEKLGYLRPSRLGKEEEEGKKRTKGARERLVSRILLGRPWQVKSEGQPCAVCLEDFRSSSEVTALPCSHRYHSECLRPWIAGGHPSCPSCRSPVQS